MSENLSPQSPLPAVATPRHRIFGPRPLSQVVRPSYSSPEGEQALSNASDRALGEADLAYLEARPVYWADLVRYLKSNRQEFFLLYLEGMRRDFSASSQALRRHAADTDAPELSLLVLRETAHFYAFWLALRVSLAFPLSRPLWALLARLFAGLPAAARPARAQEATSSRA